MKKLTFLVIAAFLTTSLLLSGCGKKAEQAAEEHEHHTEMDSTATAYSCPMHPEEKGKEGDKCSKCGMPLEAMNATDTTKTN